MKRLLPVAAMTLMLALIGFNTSIARLMDNRNLEVELKPILVDIPELKVDIYPNPVLNNQITVQTNKDIQTLKILSVVGSVIYEATYLPGTTLVQLNLDKLERGIYLLKLHFDEKTTYTEKILVH